ncbi:MAG: GNAT family N-acetyltransferase [Clostridia bacterium]|nr:GNAT family N-acetyltransferase [Clostridia bacterium]
MILETERLILRPWEEADAEECFKYAQDSRIGPAAGWPVHTSVENSRQVIRDVLSGPETYVIVLKETGLPVGSIGLHHNDLASGEDESELGYWLGAPYWGQGLVPEAAREMLRHAFEDLGLRRVWCGYYDGNDKSRRVQEKLGFRYQWTTENVPVPMLGETRKGHVSLMTREEWESMITLKKAAREDLELIYTMQLKAFAPLYAKYQDTETSPAAEPFERTLRRFENNNITYYLILRGKNVIGSIRVRKQGQTYVLVQILILPEYQNQGYAQEAIRKAEALYPDAASWRLDTIAQEEKLCHLYQKMGYRRTGESERIKEGMDIIFFEKTPVNDPEKRHL